MSNFGFPRLRVVNPYEVAFREARSAVGASALLASAEEYQNVADAVADCPLVVGTTALRSRRAHQPLRQLKDGARLIRKQLGRSHRIALLFGSEKFGLSNEALSHCHWLLRIPTREENISMNLGQAGGGWPFYLPAHMEAAQPPSQRENTPAAQNERRIRALLCTTSAQR